MALIVGGYQPTAVDSVVVVLIAVAGVRVELIHVGSGDQQTSARCRPISQQDIYVTEATEGEMWT